MKINSVILVVGIFLVIFCNSVVYGALNTDMYIDGDAYVRIDKNIRITDIKVMEQFGGAYETYNCDYSKDTTSIQVTLPSNASFVIYEVTITNNDKVDYILSDIVEEVYSNHDISYEIVALEKNGVIKANSSVVFQIKFTTTIDNFENNCFLTLKYKFLEVVPVGTTYSFSYTGDVQEFMVPCNGIYKLELWGGGNGNTTSSKVSYGGYTSGNVELKIGTSLYVYVGQNGYVNGTVFNGTNDVNVGTNGGGGATDIRLINGSWDNFDSLKSRIMVAAGAGGAGWAADGGSAGGLTGYTTTRYHVNNGKNYMGKGATQIAGGMGGNNNTTLNGMFGKGGIINLGSYGGGGYYGGGGGYGIVGTDHGSGGGGSSFISGHDGCDAIKKESTENNIIHTGQSVHYSGYKFTDTKMIDGKGYNWTNVIGTYTAMPTHDGKSTMVGNNGNGYAKIILLERK